MSIAYPYRRFTGAALLAVIFIVYGSLYPFHFHAGSLGEAVIALFLSHHMHEQPWSGLIANIALYVPLGLCCVAAQSDRRAFWQKIGLTMAIGLVLCLAVEITQFFDASRVTTLTDVYPNIGGTLLGALVALPLGRFSIRPIDLSGPVRQVAALVLLLFLGYRLFPYAPTLDLHAYWQAIKPLLYHPTLDIFDIARYGVIWIVVAAMLADLAGRRASRWLIALGMLAVLFAQIVIIHNRLAASELLVLPFVVLLWQALAGAPRARVCGFVALLVALLVLAERLLPFHWQTVGHGFGWIPFFSILHGSMAANTQALAEKLFLYTSLIWLLRGAGLRYLMAGAMVAAGLMITSLLETHLPGRSAEITDATIAILAAAALSSLAPARAPEHRLSAAIECETASAKQ